jgi:TonB family protein
MLVWSFVLHALFLGATILAMGLRSHSSTLPPPVGEFININLGQSGPIPGSGGGGTPAPKPPPKAEPEPVPAKEKPPEVVRPTKEVRDEIPSPDAKTTRKTAEPKPDTGLRGADAASAKSAELQSGGAPGLGPGGAGGGSAFDQDFDYAYYVRQMMAKVQQHWQRTAVRGTAVVIVRFTILRDGSVENPEIEASSGIALLDRSALRAVILADPLPPLPNSYPRDQVGVHLRFTYSDSY